MPVVVEDLIDKGTLEASTDGGLTATRTFKITGLTGPGSKRLYQAYLSGVPQEGSVHPTIPGLICSKISFKPEPGSNGIAEAVANYAQQTSSLVLDQPPQISIGSSVQSVKTNRDYQGNLIFTGYRYSGDTADTLQGGEVEVMRPQVVFKYSGRRTTNPRADALQYVGKVNSAGSISSTARVILCTRIDVTSPDGGVTWNYEYEFQYNPSGWDATIIFIDPETNAPPSNLVVGTGIKTYQLYTEANFAPLGVN